MPIATRVYRWFCPTHEWIFAGMTEDYLERFEGVAIEKALPDFGHRLVADGVMDKLFKDMSRDEVCRLIAAAVLSYRASLDREAELAKEIPF